MALNDLFCFDCRHTWYQSQSHTFIEIFAKGVKKADLEVDFGEQIVSQWSAACLTPHIRILRSFHLKRTTFLFSYCAHWWIFKLLGFSCRCTFVVLLSGLWCLRDGWVLHMDHLVSLFYFQISNWFFNSKSVSWEKKNLFLLMQLSVVINSANSEEPYVLQLRLFGKVSGCLRLQTSFSSWIALHLLMNSVWDCLLCLLSTENLEMQIVPAQCSYNPLSTKVEIKLSKADSIQWKQLEFDPKTQIVKTAVIPEGLDSVPSWFASYCTSFMILCLVSDTAYGLIVVLLNFWYGPQTWGKRWSTQHQIRSPQRTGTGWRQKWRKKYVLYAND